MAQSSLSDIGEFGLIRMIQQNSAIGKGVVKGIGDDTAVLQTSKDKLLLFTTDMLIEDVHFTRRMPADAVGHKALACNISDIAAMGGVPTFAVVSLGLPAKLSVDYVKGLYDGINQLAKKFGVSIVGGDTNQSKKIVINIALLGEADQKNVVMRSGAKRGDIIFVSGCLGNSFANKRHLSFMPRLELSQILVRHFKPTAMIDISDGLAADLGHILEQSKVGAFLYEDQIPLAKGAKVKNALYDGEDFELLFTLPLEQAQDLHKMKYSFSFFPIGQIVDPKKGAVLINKRGGKETIKFKGYRHF